MGSSPSVTTSAPGPTLAPTGNTELEPPAVVVDPQTQAADIQQQQPAPAAESNDSPAAPTVKPMVLAKEDRPVDRVFQNIVNFRDVGKNYNSDSGTNRLREGWFFRSGRLDDASTVDLELLTETFGIKVVVDLRSETEGKMGDGLVNTFPASVINEHAHLAEILKPETTPLHHQESNNPDTVKVIRRVETIPPHKEKRRHRIRKRVRRHRHRSKEAESSAQADAASVAVVDDKVRVSDVEEGESGSELETVSETDDDDSSGGTRTPDEPKKDEQVNVVVQKDGTVAPVVTSLPAVLDDNSPMTTSRHVQKRVTFYINFAGNNFRRRAVWKPLPLRYKLKAISLLAVNNRAAVVRLVGAHSIQPSGLLGLNKAFVTHCGAEIVSALRLLSNINHYPVLVHCTQGKDRTGLVVGLALHCAGVTEEFILKDYVRTQEGLKAQYEVMVEEMRKTGLDSSFSDAPEEVMRETLKFIRETYGSIDGYLDSLKFGPAERTRLGSCLLAQS